MKDFNLKCRNCGLAWPGDDVLTTDELLAHSVSWLPICIKAPPADRWFIDSGINGHIFDLIDRTPRPTA